MTGLALSPELAEIARTMFDRLRAAKRILAPTHVNVDGDSLGSVMGLSRALRAAGLEVVTVVSDGKVPAHLRFLLEDDAPLLFTGEPLPPTDLSCVIDITGLGRLGPLASLTDRFVPECVLNVDHHLSNERFGVLNLVDTTAAATAELIVLLLAHWGLPLTAEVATPLLAGLMTDTLSFQTAATTPRAMRVAGALLAAGAPLEPLVSRLFRAKPLSTARLFGAVVAAARLEAGLLWSEVTPAMLAACGAQASETEGIITYLTGVEEAVVFALLYTQPDGWRASLRSNSDAINVATLAGRFGGGGHARAAGCTLVGDQAVRDAFLATIQSAIVTAGLLPAPAASAAGGGSG